MAREPVLRSHRRTLADTSIPARSRHREPGGLLLAEFNYPDGSGFLIQNFNIIPPPRLFFSIMKNEREEGMHWVWALLVYEIRGLRGECVSGGLELVPG